MLRAKRRLRANCRVLNYWYTRISSVLDLLRRSRASGLIRRSQSAMSGHQKGYVPGRPPVFKRSFSVFSVAGLLLKRPFVNYLPTSRVTQYQSICRFTPIGTESKRARHCLVIPNIESTSSDSHLVEIRMVLFRVKPPRNHWQFSQYWRGWAIQPQQGKNPNLTGHTVQFLNCGVMERF